MTCSAPIGIFDSGIGGLTVMHELMKRLPQESMVYLGDTARVPYGNKSPDTIIRYSIENAEFLVKRGIKLLIIACNSASAYCVDILRKQLPIPVIDVIGPGAEKALQTSKNKQIAILATKATITSQAYQQTLRQQCPHANIYPIACPLLVPLVEEGFVNHQASPLIIREYLSQLDNQQIDTILLGCTHYPLIKDLLKAYFKSLKNYSDPLIVDSATTCAEKVRQLLIEEDLRSADPPYYHYYVTDDPKNFQTLGHKIVGIDQEHISNIEKISLDFPTTI